MIKIIILVISIFFGASVINAEDKPTINYKYKKYERFDFDDLMVEGEFGSPGDLTVTPQFQRYYKNSLPKRENFHPEIKSAIDSVN